MRIAVVAGGVPNPDTGGSYLSIWTLVSWLVGRSHHVSVLVVSGGAFHDPTGAAAEQRADALRALGAEVRFLPSRAAGVARRRRVLAQALRPSDEELLPGLTDAPTVRRAVEELAPDAVWTYNWDALAATRELRGVVPRMGVVVDLAHLPELYRFRREPKPLGRETLARALLLQASLRRLPRLMVRLLGECEASADFAAHHAEWLRRKGVERCRYLRTPVEDRAGDRWRAERDRLARSERPRILFIGHLLGTSTLDGLDLFAREVLPRLERALGPDGLEVRIAGGWQPPADIGTALDRPSVRFLGHLTSPDEEFSSAHALVVPTAIPLGARVRILSSFSFGCPVVAHTSNALGIPELEDGGNVLMGRNAAELADGVLRAIEDGELRRRLEERGRDTYERYFAPAAAGAAIEQVLESIARVRPGSPPAVAPPPTPARP